MISRIEVEEEQEQEQEHEPEFSQTARLGDRVIAYLIDFLLFNGVIVVLLFGSIRILMISTTNALSIMATLAMIPLLLAFFVTWFLNVPICVILWKTNGLTPGKRLRHLRVVKQDQSPLSFNDIFMRECLIKGVADNLLAGLLTFGSFAWACLTPEHRTVHDLAANTKVIYDQSKTTKTKSDE